MANKDKKKEKKKPKKVEKKAQRQAAQQATERAVSSISGMLRMLETQLAPLPLRNFRVSLPADVGGGTEDVVGHWMAVQNGALACYRLSPGNPKPVTGIIWAKAAGQWHSLQELDAVPIDAPLRTTRHAEEMDLVGARR